MAKAATLFGRQLKYWRQFQGISQLSLATLANTTTRHLSFLENGRSRPSEPMVRRLAEALEIPVRERNQLLKAAGFAGTYREEHIDEESLRPYMGAIKYMMDSHAPYPAILKNRYHEVLDMNEPARRLFLLLDPAGPRGRSLVEWLLDPGSVALGLFENYKAVAWNLIYRVRGEAAENPNDQRMQELARFAENRAKELGPHPHSCCDLVSCPTMRLDGKRIQLMGMVARFGSAQEVTLDNLRVELMHPRDKEAAEFFHDLAKRPPLRVAR